MSHWMHSLRAVAEHAGVPVASAAIAWRWPFEQAAIPSGVLFMAFIGAAIWIFMEQPSGARLRVYGMAICFALLSAAGAVLVVNIFTLEKAMAAPIALLLSSGGKRLYNAYRDGAAERMRKATKGDP